MHFNTGFSVHLMPSIGWRGSMQQCHVEPPPPISDPEPLELRRTDAVFGLIHEYRLVA